MTSSLRDFLAAAGATAEIRSSAVSQTAELAKANPAQLPYLVDRVRCAHQSGIEPVLIRQADQKDPLQAHAVLQHKDWEARVASGQLLGLLSVHCAVPTVADVSAALSASQSQTQLSDLENSPMKAGVGCKELSDVSIADILRDGSPLLASSGEVRHGNAAHSLLSTIEGQT